MGFGNIWGLFWVIPILGQDYLWMHRILWLYIDISLIKGNIFRIFFECFWNFLEYFGIFLEYFGIFLEYFKIFLRYFMIFLVYFEIFLEYLKIFLEYLMIFLEYLKIFLEYLKIFLEYLKIFLEYFGKFSWRINCSFLRKILNLTKSGDWINLLDIPFLGSNRECLCNIDIITYAWSGPWLDCPRTSYTHTPLYLYIPVNFSLSLSPFSLSLLSLSLSPLSLSLSPFSLYLSLSLAYNFFIFFSDMLFIMMEFHKPMLDCWHLGLENSYSDK